MPRRIRTYITGLPYHLVQRGNNREACFVEPDNYQFYLDLWKECAMRYGVSVHAYCLMTNHIHFLVTPSNSKAISRDSIVIKGARVHNLKNIDVEIPRNKLVVITGLSGSGKSSLAFDTIYAEGQRRYVESLSSYARQFLGLMDKPDVDQIDGLAPAISIDQRNVSHNPRSTVGTTTEIYDYLRLLFARIGKPHCPKCGDEVKKQTVDQIVEKIYSLVGPSTRRSAPHSASSSWPRGNSPNKISNS